MCGGVRHKGNKIVNGRLRKQSLEPEAIKGFVKSPPNFTLMVALFTLWKLLSGPKLALKIILWEPSRHMATEEELFLGQKSSRESISSSENSSIK